MPSACVNFPIATRITMDLAKRGNLPACMEISALRGNARGILWVGNPNQQFLASMARDATVRIRIAILSTRLMCFVYICIAEKTEKQIKNKKINGKQNKKQKSFYFL